MTKRVISIGLILTMVICQFFGNTRVMVSAADHTEKRVTEEYEYEIVEEKAVLTKYIGAERNVTVPDTIEGLKIGTIETGAFSETQVTSVTIPSTISNIADRAFVDCPELQEVEFRSNAGYKDETSEPGEIHLGNEVFVNCPKLRRVTMPKTVTELGENIFDVQNNVIIYTYESSAAEAYAEQQGLNCIYLSGTALHKTCDYVEVISKDARLENENVQLKVEWMESGEEFDRLTNDIEGAARLYHVQLLDENGEILEHVAKMTIVFHVSLYRMQKEVRLYRIEEDDTKTEMETEWYSSVETAPLRFPASKVDTLGTFVLEAPYAAGDVNGDMTVDTQDALEVLKGVVGLRSFSKFQTYTADVDDDSSVTLDDALMILKYVVGIIQKFPSNGGC